MFLALTKFGVIIAALLIFWISLQRSRQNQFYSDMPLYLLPTGIFVWGDGLILAPFWLLAGLLSILAKFSLINMVQFYLFFWIVRSSFETIYWIDHQMVKKDYVPPHFRRIEWLAAEEQGIIYQLLNMTMVIFSAVFLYLTFQT